MTEARGTTADDVTEQQQREWTETNDKLDSDEFTTWAQDLKTQTPDIDYDAVADDIANTVNTPEITEADYLEDNYFEPIFSYLKNDHLPTDNNAARKILLMSENYFIENNLLYKVSLPRSKTEQRVRPQNYLLCIPVNHTAKLLGKWHSILGHYGPN